MKGLAVRWILLCALLNVYSGALLFSAAVSRAEAPVDFVNPMIGTGAGGHVYPGAAVPFGFVQVSPDTTAPDAGGGFASDQVATINAWDYCSGYRYEDTNLLGFSLNHLTGTGCPDMGNILFLPTVGELKLSSGKTPGAGRLTPFSHNHEEARPGYYRVFLPEFNVNVELTATTRVGLQRYTFPETTNAHVILDLYHGIGNHPTDTLLTIENDHTISGYRKELADECFRPAGVAEYYFVAEFSKPFATSGIQVAGKEVGGNEAQGLGLKAHFDYQTKAGEKIVIRVGLSTVSVEGARKNLRAEVNTWDFDAVAAAARERWAQELGKIQVETKDADMKKIFYTALYHTQLTPIVFSDVDGQFRGPDHQVHRAEGFDYYTDLSLWDTFRAEQPLLTLLQPRRDNDIVQSMLLHFDLTGQQMLPMITYGGRETYCMIGNHSIPVIVDAYLKGICKTDAERAYAAMKTSSTVNHPKSQWDLYMRYGYLPSDLVKEESVSRTLECAYDDWCVAQMAKMLGKKSDYELFSKRSMFYRNLFDKSTGLMRGRNSDRTWVEPFDTLKISHAGDAGGDYTEGNAWQYTWFVPQNPCDLISLMGGDKAFVSRLDKLFTMKSTVYGSGFTGDVTGLIGQYVQGNEPCHHVTYLYDYAGEPWKTQARVREIATTLYASTPGGLCGNDDCGQMSAWYLFAALGFYPVNPASGVYVIGSPLVDKATIQLDPKYYPGRTFSMEAENNSPENIYIQSATFDGRPLNRSWISHEEIVHGGKLILVMGPTPNRTWATAQADRPAQELTH